MIEMVLFQTAAAYTLVGLSRNRSHRLGVTRVWNQSPVGESLRSSCCLLLVVLLFREREHTHALLRGVNIFVVTSETAGVGSLMSVLELEFLSAPRVGTALGARVRIGNASSIADN